MTNKQFSSVTIDEIIEKLQDNSEIFRSETGEPYIKTLYDGKISPIDSGDFELWLRNFCYHQMDGLYPPPGATSQISGHLRMLAQNSDTKKLHYRICFKNNSIYYDLGLNDNRYYKICGKNIKIVHNSDLIFVRNHVFQKQVKPDLSGSPAEILSFIEKYFNFSSDNEALLFAVFLISCFFAETMPMPVIQLSGEKASGKTFCEKRILDLINPTSTGILMLPKKVDDVAICLASDYIIAFDNVSWISKDLSDLLCSITYGGKYTKRKLFTDSTQKVMDLRAIFIFNSVSSCVTQSDLADRILSFHFERISDKERLSEKELLNDWREDLPRFLGDIFLAIQGILNDNSDTMYASPFRLIDFYNIAVKAGKQLGFSEDDIYFALDENVNNVNESIVSNDPLLMTIEHFMSHKNREEGYKALPTTLYNELKIYAYEELSINSRYFPLNASTLSKKLLANKSNLEKLGIYFELGKKKDRFIYLYKK